jgi:hypothetical protein
LLHDINQVIRHTEHAILCTAATIPRGVF